MNLQLDVYQTLLDTAKLIFYPERSLSFFLEKARDKINDEGIICNLEKWINKGNYVDLKQFDVIEGDWYGCALQLIKGR